MYKGTVSHRFYGDKCNVMRTVETQINIYHDRLPVNTTVCSFDFYSGRIDGFISLFIGSGN